MCMSSVAYFLCFFFCVPLWGSISIKFVNYYNIIALRIGGIIADDMDTVYENEWNMKEIHRIAYITSFISSVLYKTTAIILNRRDFDDKEITIITKEKKMKLSFQHFTWLFHVVIVVVIHLTWIWLGLLQAVQHAMKFNARQTSKPRLSMVSLGYSKIYSWRFFFGTRKPNIREQRKWNEMKKKENIEWGIKWKGRKTEKSFNNNPLSFTFHQGAPFENYQEEWWMTLNRKFTYNKSKQYISVFAYGEVSSHPRSLFSIAMLVFLSISFTLFDF